MKEAIISLRNVARFYQMGDNLVKALDCMHIKVRAGDFVAIMGQSGSGKSTAMNLLGSLDLPTHGRIYLDGADISHMSESELAQVRGKKIGFIFESFNLIQNMTAKENVMLPMLFQGVEKEEREKKAEELFNPDYFVFLNDDVSFKYNFAVNCINFMNIKRWEAGSPILMKTNEEIEKILSMDRGLALSAIRNSIKRKGLLIFFNSSLLNHRVVPGYEAEDEICIYAKKRIGQEAVSGVKTLSRFDNKAMNFR